MTKEQLERVYRDYIECLNSRDLSVLERYVHQDVTHDGRPLGLSGYREMLEKDFDDIPDLRFNVELLVVDPPHLASRLHFNCTPRARFMNLDVDGIKVSFAENVFCKFDEGKIARVWSVIDKAGIEDQLQSHHGGR